MFVMCDSYRRTADVRSVGYSELIMLSRDDVLSALKDHPDAEVSYCLISRTCVTQPLHEPLYMFDNYSFYYRKMRLWSGPYVGFYFGGGLKIRGGERRGPNNRSPRPERPRAEVGFLGRGQPAPPHQLGGLGERCKLPQWGPGRSPGRPSGLLHFVDARWLFLAFQRLLAKHQRPHIMEHVILIQ